MKAAHRSSTSAEARTERLWKDYFRDPSLWWDKRKSKTNPRAPDFKHKLTREPLWMDGWYNPSWVKNRLRLEETEEHKSAHEEVNATAAANNSAGWGMLSLEEALLCLEEGLPPQPSVEDFACILGKCRKARDRVYALRLHVHMHKCGLESHSELGNYLVLMWVEVGSMTHAQQVFDRLVYRTESSWNSLITGCIRYGNSQHALTLYQKMLEDDSIYPTGPTFVAILKACSNLKDLGRGLEIHAEVSRTGLLERDLFVGNTLVDMYAKCGSPAKAQQVFDKLPVQDVVSWTALIAGYVEHRLSEEALMCFELMQLQGVFPDDVTFVCSLKACGSIGARDKGQEIHTEIAKKGWFKKDLVVGNTLVDMYAKCGLLAEAQQVFDKLSTRDVVSWNALITGYAEHRHGKEALECFEQMQLKGFSPDAVTFVCSLKSCGSIQAIDKGQEIHAEIARNGLLETDLVVANTLIDMYAKCGLLAKAQEVFEKLPVQNMVSWSVLITGYVEHGHGEGALACFEQMQLKGVFLDAVILVCLLKACSSIGATNKGREIHAEIVRKGLLERDLFVASTLVDMYAKCGSLAEAQQVFVKLPVRGVVSWSALITGYAEEGCGEEALQCFEQMQLEGVSPDAVMFVGVYKACSHAGLFDKGQTYFEAMSKDYGIIPTLEHHTCMVDLFCRAGQLDKAVAMVKKMPFHPNLVVWHSVLDACRKWGNVELGRRAFEHAMQLDEKNDVAYM